jgi:carbonyl reductase 1
MKTAIVTGANQGLGFALAEGLAQRLDPGDVVHLTGRNGDRVRAAAARLASPRAEVRPRVLDVRDGDAVDRFAAEVGEVDIVFSNAAARIDRDTPPAELVGTFVDTNNVGTTRMLRAFHPRLRPGGRLLVVASALGSLRRIPEPLRARFEAQTLDDIDATMLAWRDAVIDGHAAAEGWPEWINVPSKVGQVAAVRVAARERRDGTLVAAVCPGLVDTAASRPFFDMSDAQTPKDAAVALLDLALAPTPDPRFHGELVQFGEVIPWR